jgi:hypothetical protein
MPDAFRHLLIKLFAFAAGLFVPGFHLLREPVELGKGAEDTMGVHPKLIYKG